MSKMNKNAEYMDRKNPPALTLKPRKETLSTRELNAIVESLKIPERSRTVISGLLFLWHDHWKEAHAAAHEHEGDADYDLLHALVHRREGDYWNSEYWLREVGKHPLFDMLGDRIVPLLSGEEDLLQKIVPGGRWNAKGFVAAIKAQPDLPILREIQAEEYLCFYGLLTR